MGEREKKRDRLDFDIETGSDMRVDEALL